MRTKFRFLRVGGAAMRGGESEGMGGKRIEKLEKEMSMFMWGYLPGVSP